MQVAGIVLLDAVLQRMGRAGAGAFTSRLGRGIEVALALVLLQGLGHDGLRKGSRVSGLGGGGAARSSKKARVGG